MRSLQALPLAERLRLSREADVERAERAAAELLCGWHRRLRPMLHLLLFHKRRRGASTSVEVHIVEWRASGPLHLLLRRDRRVFSPAIFAEPCALANPFPSPHCLARRAFFRGFALVFYSLPFFWMC